MKIDETAHKSFSTQPKKRKHYNQHTKHKQLRIDSLVCTGYTRPHTHGLGIWKNPRVPFTVRVDKELKKQFSLASKAFSGSTCSAIEYIMAAYVGAYKSAQINGVYPTLTVDIGTIKIERNLRERRKLTIETETEESVTFQKCGYRGCNNEAVGKGLFVQSNTEFLLCADHLNGAKHNRKNWANIEVA